MKKHISLFTTLFLMAFAVKAQKPDMATVMVHYKFSHWKDTTQPKPYTENMILMIGKSATVYKSYDRRLEDALVRKQIQEQLAAGSGRISIKRNGSGSGTEYYQFAKEKKLFRKEKLINSYLIEESLPVINWKISKDTASFSGLHCQKATTHFKGRDYTAWFCPDIPSQSGPWKLSGLPGLILEAYDTKKQIVFKFDGIEDVSKMEAASALPVAQKQPSNEGNSTRQLIATEIDNSDPQAIQLPTDAIKTTEKEFMHLREAMIKDPNAFAQSAMAAAGANRPNGPQMQMKIQVSPDVENNPIELPEKKK
jgi:GLPGLI family protein